MSRAVCLIMAIFYVVASAGASESTTVSTRLVKLAFNSGYPTQGTDGRAQ